MGRAPKVYKYEYEMIDGNWTVKPTGYCYKYRGYLTDKMAKVHRCKQKRCRLFETFDQHENNKGSAYLPDFVVPENMHQSN